LEGVRAPLLRAPAELAGQVAGVHRGGHLEASVALDPVEGLLIAADALRQACFRPVAELHAAVLPDDAIALTFEDLLFLRVHPPPDAACGLKGFRGENRGDAAVGPSASAEVRADRCRRRETLD